MSKQHACRSCGERKLCSVLWLGATSLGGALLTDAELGAPEYTAELELVFCPVCTLAQITETVPAEMLYSRSYPCYASVSPALSRHYAASAGRLIESRGLGPTSFVLEASSNDGCMLRHFAERGIPTLGIEPIAGPAEAAKRIGVSTLNTFFTRELAYYLRNQCGLTVELFLANNVLAQVADLNGFVEGVQVLLRDDGVAVIEVPYLISLIENVAFDTIYHQHLCYFSATALDTLFRRHSLYLNEVERTDMHGGSLRLFVEKREAVGDSTRALLHRERGGIDSWLQVYSEFNERVQKLRESLLNLLHSIRRSGGRIAAYGAAAKATTLLTYCGIDSTLIDYIVDLNPRKHGKFMGGSRIPICPVARLMENKPDYVLLLAWSFCDEILRQQASYLGSGGQFIIPVPEPRVVSSLEAAIPGAFC
ncbi:MAG: class I SAM-dependent methyltransferase [Bryobacteraceae bacterium]